jgi:hypothetical protein
VPPMRKWFPIALREMWISLSAGAADAELFQHHSLNPGLIRLL